MKFFPLCSSRDLQKFNKNQDSIATDIHLRIIIFLKLDEKFIKHFFEIIFRRKRKWKRIKYPYYFLKIYFERKK